MDLMLLAFFGFMYFLPSVWAAARKHNNVDAIFMLNLLLGWTVLGWIVAGVWAFTDNRRKIA